MDARTPITEEARTCRVEASIMLMPQQRNMRVQMQGSSSCRAALLEVHDIVGDVAQVANRHPTPWRSPLTSLLYAQKFDIDLTCQSSYVPAYAGAGTKGCGQRRSASISTSDANLAKCYAGV